MPLKWCNRIWIKRELRNYLLLKKHFLIFVFCFSFLLFKAQGKPDSTINFALLDSPAYRAYFRSSYYPSFIPYAHYSNFSMCLKTPLPKLPFFCNMEDKFRNKFNVFLKIRAGNDESYMRMITPNNRE